MQDLGTMEDKIFKDRQSRELSFRARNKAKRRAEREATKESDQAPAWIPEGQFAPQALGGRKDVQAVHGAKSEAISMRQEGMQANKTAAQELKAQLKASRGGGGEDSNPGSNYRPPGNLTGTDPEPGMIYHGKVQNITSFGCFVALEGFGRKVEGLVHISELSREGRVDSVEDAVSRGEKVKVKVLSIGGGKTSLSIKDVDQTTGKDLNVGRKCTNVSLKRGADDSDSEEEAPDEVKLYEDGFKDRYYESKFGVLPEDRQFRHRVAAEYTIGLCWVLRYYYQGTPSWKWYFPYHYAPFASDFVNIGDVPNEFEKNTQPFKPLEQLMGVFPAASRSHVPKPWADLMIDPEASIIDFYPEDFKIDLNGKKYAWQGVALLPFVEEVRLKAALKPLYSELTDAEVQRNIRGDDRIFVKEGHPGYNLLRTIYTENLGEDTEVIMSPSSFQGLGGRVLFSKDNCEPGGMFPTPVRSLEDITNIRTVCVRYRDPKYDENFVFSAKRLDGAVDPPAVLKPGDFDHRGNARGGGGANYTPRSFGFGQRTDQASLDGAGHRMLNHYTNRNQVDTGLLS